MAWEYKQVQIDRNATVENRQEMLDTLGADGWELKTQLTTSSRNDVLVFARSKIEEAKPAKPSSSRPLNG